MRVKWQGGPHQRKSSMPPHHDNVPGHQGGPTIKINRGPNSYVEAGGAHPVKLKEEKESTWPITMGKAKRFVGSSSTCTVWKKEKSKSRHLNLVEHVFFLLSSLRVCLTSYLAIIWSSPLSAPSTQSEFKRHPKTTAGSLQEH